MRTDHSLGKSLVPGKIDARRRSWLDGITDAMSMNLRKLQKMVRNRRPGMLQSMGHKKSDMAGNLNNNKPYSASKQPTLKVSPASAVDLE